MNQLQQMKDPAAGVPPQLLPHLHLISKHRYPQTNNPSIESVVQYLIDAPKIINEAQPVQWQMLDCPTDGTIMLMWQPPDLSTNFASDGYVWSDHEQVFNSDVRGHNLQMYLHRSGFRPGVEAMATHSRRRYRLLPTQQNMGGVMPDPSLWLIHYSTAQQRDHVPAAKIQIPQQIHAQLQHRRAVFSQGALARKEFMLRDRANWPTINVPGGRQASAGQAAAPHRRGGSTGAPEATVEEEEDVSRGDALDFLTPRDVSRMRYEQNHEWMEEVLESPYRTMSIVPTELGLGRKGELESLTKPFFDAPTSVADVATDGHPARVGKMDPAKAADFTRLANERISAMQAELDKMKLAHLRRMEKLKRSSALSQAEKRLRSVQTDTTASKGSQNGMTSPGDAPDALDEAVKDVEQSFGKSVKEVKLVTMLSKGGYQSELTPQAPALAESRSVSSGPAVPAQQNVPSQHQGQQQSLQPSGPQSTQQGVEDPEPSMAVSATPTQAQSRPVSQGQPALTTEEDLDDDTDMHHVGDDMDMTGLDDPSGLDVQPDDTGDWVMIGDKDVPNVSGAGVHASGAAAAHVGGLQSHNTNEQATMDGTSAQDALQDPDQQASGHTPLDTADFDLGNDFENTAGDALADFGADDDLNLDDSAFGDAFPPQD